jgi:hypothetical protein
MSNLQKLIEAVERGTLTGSDKMFYPTGTAEMITRAVGGEWLWEDVCLAHDGDLNSAKALHEALLPGWIFAVTNNSAFVMREIPDSDLTDDYLPQYLGENDIPARAWLLSILRAYAAQQVAKTDEPRPERRADAITDRG